MKKAILKKHLAAIEKLRDSCSKGNAGHMRKTVLWYLKGFPLAAKMRQKVSLVNSYEKMLKLLDTL